MANTPAVDIFGETSDGEKVKRFTLKNKNQVEVQILSLGGIITSILVPDKSGKLADITPGFDSVQEYEKNPAYFGALIGRFGNRIKHGEFSLDGVKYKLAVNNGPNHLHGGIRGYDKRLWEATVDGSRLKLVLVSADGEENYPGEVTVTVTYDLNEENELVIDYSATATKATPINLTNHAYFNLAGHKGENIYDHTVTVFAEKFTPKCEEGIPLGDLASVAGTVFDLRKPVVVGERIHNIPIDKGYDHNFCLEGKDNKKLAARVEHEPSGRILEVYTDQPGIQFYTGNYLDDIPGKDGACYKQHSSFALETQNYPDAINKPNFPNCVLQPGQIYRHTCWYKFITKS